MADVSTSVLTTSGANEITRMSFTLASGQVVYQGTNAALDITTGTVKNGTGGNTNLRLIGKFEHDYDSTSGAIPCVVQLGRPMTGRWLKNDTIAPVTAAYVGRQVYVKDNVTVTLTATANSVAGICWAVSAADGVLVEMLPPVPAPSAAANWAVDTTTAAWTGTDWAPAGASLVNGTIYVLPTTNTGAKTVTLPSTGVADGTVIRLWADGTTNSVAITVQQGTTALGAAFTASKRVLVDCTCVANVWMVDGHESP